MTLEVHRRAQMTTWRPTWRCSIDWCYGPVDVCLAYGGTQKAFCLKHAQELHCKLGEALSEAETKGEGDGEAI